MPIGLLKALGGVLKLDDGVIEWGAHGSTSAIRYLPSGHPAIDAADGLDRFQEDFPEAARFARAEEYLQAVRRLEEHKARVLQDARKDGARASPPYTKKTTASQSTGPEVHHMCDESDPEDTSLNELGCFEAPQGNPGLVLALEQLLKTRKW